MFGDLELAESLADLMPDLPKYFLAQVLLHILKEIMEILLINHPIYVSRLFKYLFLIEGVTLTMSRGNYYGWMGDIATDKWCKILQTVGEYETY